MMRAPLQVMQRVLAGQLLVTAVGDHSQPLLPLEAASSVPWLCEHSHLAAFAVLTLLPTACPHHAEKAEGRPAAPSV